MRVTFINRHPLAADPDGHIAADDLRREFSRGLSALGHTVTVVQEHPVAASRTDGDVTWNFVAPNLASRAVARMLRPRADAWVKTPGSHLLAPVRASKPDILHSFDLVFYPSLWQLGRLAASLRAPLVAHFHGGAPARTPALRAIESRALNQVAALCFTTREAAAPWEASGALADLSRVHEVAEMSSRFTPGARAAARAELGLDAGPHLLHLGRLDAVKDPLTTLAAFRRLSAQFPGATLHLAYTQAPLLAEVLTASDRLRVRHWGQLRPGVVQLLLRASDVLVQASVREVCGRSVLEALASDVPVVLSDIPSFRRLSDDGRLGGLFPVGDADAMAGAMAAALRGPSAPGAVRAWFEERWSYARLSADVSAMYQSLRAG